MNQLRIVLASDDVDVRNDLTGKLRGLDDAEVVAEADSIESAIAALVGTPLDLLILDVDLREASGFEVLHRSNVACDVVVVSAYEDRALRAFEVAALDFLLKPVRRERLRQSLLRARSRPKPCWAMDCQPSR